MAPMRHATDTRWTLEDARECFKPGERWAYREPKRRGYREAEIHSIAPDSSPPRVRIIIYEDGFEVARKAVPCGRLKTPWSGVEELLEQEARDRRVRANGPNRAEATVLGWALDSGDSDYWHLSDAVAVIYDAGALATEFGLSVEDLADPDGYGDQGCRTVGWAVLRKLVGVALMRNDAQLARDLLAYTNSARRERAELVQERRLEYPWLEADHPALDLKVEYADEIEEGLESLCPGMVEIRRHEHARRLLRETDDLLQSILTRHGKFNRKLQADEIDADIRAFRKRLGLFELEAAGGGERFLAAED